MPRTLAASVFSGVLAQRGDGGVARWEAFFEEQNSGGKRLASVCHTRPSGRSLVSRNSRHSPKSLLHGEI